MQVAALPRHSRVFSRNEITVVSGHWKLQLRRISRQDLCRSLRTVLGFVQNRSTSPCALSCTEHLGWLLQKQTTRGHLSLLQLGGNKNWGRRLFAISSSGWSNTLTHTLTKEATGRRTTLPQNIHFIGLQMAQRDEYLVTANSLLSETQVKLPHTTKARFVPVI